MGVFHMSSPFVNVWVCVSVSMCTLWVEMVWCVWCHHRVLVKWVIGGERCEENELAGVFSFSPCLVLSDNCQITRGAIRAETCPRKHVWSPRCLVAFRHDLDACLCGGALHHIWKTHPHTQPTHTHTHMYACTPASSMAKVCFYLTFFYVW